MTTYAQLTTDVATFAHQSLTAYMPRFVALAEAKLNRLLRVRQMEEAASGAITSYEVTLPADYAGTKALWIEGHEASPLRQMPHGVVTSWQSQGVASMYTVTDTAWRFDGTGTLAGVYYKTLPGLEANSTNWLSVAAYDVYLAGALEQAFRYVREPEQEAKEAARFTSLISELNRGAYQTGALASTKG